MAIRKHVLLVDKPDSPLTAVVPELKALDFSVMLVSAAQPALEVVRAFPKLALVLVSSRAIHNAESFVHQVRDICPELPVVWVQEAGQPVSAERLPKVSLLLHEPIAAAVLRQHAMQLLSEHFYPAEFVDALVRSADTVFESFGLSLKSQPPFLKANRTLLSSSTAVIPFTGDNVSGYLLLSASRVEIDRIYRTIFSENPAPSIDDYEDLLGEFCNQILGRFKEPLQRKGMSFALAVPMFIRGDNVSFRQRILTPSLTVGFEETAEGLFVELCIERLVETSGEVVEEPVLESGEISFL